MTTSADLALQQFPTRDLRGLRASELARCRRMAAYRASEKPEEPTDLERRYFARGRMFGRFVAEQLELRYGPGNVVFEMPIPWEHGTAHPDIYVKSEKLFVEVKSAVSPSSLTFEMAVWQVRIYMRLQERADGAALVTGAGQYRGQVYTINPSALTRDEAIPVVLDDLHRQQIDVWINEVTHALDDGPLPERVCRRPADGRPRYCPFVEKCFEGWEPQRERVDDGDILVLAQRHLLVMEDERQKRREADELKETRKEIEAQLADKVDPGEVEVGEYVVRRTHVEAREKFAIDKARKAGAWGEVHDEVFGPFVSLVGEHDRFSTKRVEGAEPLVEDFGSEPPF